MLQPADGAPHAALPGAPARSVARDTGVVATLLGLEQRARAAYLDRLVRSPHLAAIDPHLQHAYGLMRRVGAAPIYLRQPLTLLHGHCRGEGGVVAAWGRGHDLRAAVRPLFDGAPSAYDAGTLALPKLPSALRARGLRLDLVVASTTPLLAGAFRRRGFVVIPAAVQLAATLDTLRAVRARPQRSLRSDLVRTARVGYRMEPWHFSPERARLLRERYLEPYARSRFADDASLPTDERITEAYRRGLALAVLAPGSELPDLLCLAGEYGGTLHLLRLGVRDGEHALRQRGAVAAMYALVPAFAEARGLHTVNAGNSRPWLGEGALAFKWKWGYRPLDNAAQTLEWAVSFARPDGAIARRLRARRPIVRAAHGLAPLDPGDDRPDT